MWHFLHEIQIGDLPIPEEYSSAYQIAHDFLHDTSAGTLRDVPVQHSVAYLPVINSAVSPAANVCSSVWTAVELYITGGKKSLEFLDDDHVSYLSKSYKAMYSGQRQGENTSPLIQKHSHVKFGNITYGSLGSRSKRSSFILAAWCGPDGQVDIETPLIFAQHKSSTTSNIQSH